VTEADFVHEEEFPMRASESPKTKPPFVPAAQYLRMSTDQQQYSLLNQAAAITKYAGIRGFAVIKTYQDAGRSGLVLRERPGLQALLTDVVSHKFPYEAILVYDVSRWGRFQVYVVKSDAAHDLLPSLKAVMQDQRFVSSTVGGFKVRDVVDE
jgi:DNA invertase Pin-like site-specific DNA recombinase